MPAAPPYLRARVPRNEDARLLTGRALFVDDVQLPGMLHVAFVRSEHAHGRLTSVDVSAARQRAGVHAVYTAADLGDYLKPGPILVSPPPIPQSRLSRMHAAAAGQRQGSSRRRADRDDRGRQPLRCRGCDSRRRRRDRSDRCGCRSRKRARAGCSADSRTSHVEPCRACGAAERGLRLRETEGPCHREAAVPLRSRHFGRDRKSRGCGRLERKVRGDDDLGHHAGAHPDSKRARGDARTSRIAGQRHRAVRRRRLRPEDHDVLPGRGAAALGGDAIESAAEVDRGSPGELLRDDAGTRTGARRRDGAHQRRPHHRRARRLSVRHRRVRPVWADHSHQQPVHAARALRYSQLRERIHGGLHQQDDRDAGERRRAPARRVRQRAAARSGRARAWHRPRRDPQAQPDRTGQVSA